MALVLRDRVKETTTTTGTGSVTLAGAVIGYQSFSVIGNGNTCYYAISASGTSEWEVGIGTYTSSGTTLSRDTVLASSNSNSLVNFSAGTKDVYVVYPAGKSVYLDASSNVSALGTVASGTWQGTTIAAGYGGTGLTSPGTSGNVLTSNGTVWASVANPPAFSAGTVMLFRQTAAPTGWTKDTTNYNNYALRVVTGTASSGGTVAFTTAFASQTPAGSLSSTTATNQNTTATNQNTTATGSLSSTTATNQNTTATGSVDSTTLALSQIPSHNHRMRYTDISNQVRDLGYNANDAAQGYDLTGFDGLNTSYSGSSGSHNHGFTGTAHTHTQDAHTHTFTGTAHTHTQDAHTHTQDAHSHTFTGTAINLAVQYVDVIFATKD